MSNLTSLEFKCVNCRTMQISFLEIPYANMSSESISGSQVTDDGCFFCPYCDYFYEYTVHVNMHEAYFEFERKVDYNCSVPQEEEECYEEDSYIEEIGPQAIINDRNIESLFHFTRIENLENIINNGLVPRSHLEENNFVFNDTRRQDLYQEATCLSISYPNYLLLRRFRKDFEKSRWAIIEINPSLIVDHIDKCAFFETNAASLRAKGSIPHSRRLNTAFDQMFRNHSYCPSRSDLGIPSNYTTDPQAEILFFGEIPPTYFKKIHFRDSADKIEGRKLCSDIEMESGIKFFKLRCDKNHWTQKAREARIR